MSDDEPKPKRRPAWRHAVGGLALLACIALGMWRLESCEWTDWGGWWRRTQVSFGGGSSGVRNQVKIGMTQTQVRQRIGRGEEVVSKVTTWEDYPECGFGVRYDSTKTDDSWEMVATQIYDVPNSGHSPGSSR